MNKLLKLFAAVALLLSLAAADASAQEWTMWATFPGRPASVFADIYIDDIIVGARDPMDFDGDGVKDFAIVRGYDKSSPVLFVKSGADRNQTWQIPLPNNILIGMLWPAVMGFFDILPDIEPKGILIAQKMGNRYVNPVVVNVGAGNDMAFGANVVFVAAGDVNGDGRDDIIVFNPGAMEVQIWGIK